MPFPSNPKIITKSYRGPDRRGLYAEDSFSGDVEFDYRGNPIWKVKTIQLRRKEDDAAKLHAGIKVPSLTLEGEEPKSRPQGYDPYSRGD